MLDALAHRFVSLVEVVPPAGANAGPLLDQLEALAGLEIDAFSIASNPVAKPRMSALALGTLIMGRLDAAVVMHCTTRDHNRLGAWSKLCGAKALGIEVVLAATGDFVALGDRAAITTVRDLDVYDLVAMARGVGLQVGVVFDPGEHVGGVERQVDRLRRKVVAGAQFAVTQPTYDEAGAARLAQGLSAVRVPAIMGVLPLRSPRHAAFLHDRVAGITVPEAVRHRIAEAHDPVLEGLQNARHMIDVARRHFSGVCIMPAFDHYETVMHLLERKGSSTGDPATRTSGGA
jgi:homocysteine S-methyltransferase